MGFSKGIIPDDGHWSAWVRPEDEIYDELVLVPCTSIDSMTATTGKVHLHTLSSRCYQRGLQSDDTGNIFLYQNFEI